MKKKKIPIGIEDFKRLIDKGCYFVDKSLLIRDILDSGADVHLFTRPRRFGKTLNQSMIQYFFEKQDIDNSYLFEGLNISCAGEEYMEHQGKYPVITLSFKGMKKDTFEEAFTYFKWMMAQECQRHPEIAKSELISEVNQQRYQKLVNEKGDVSDYFISIQFLTDSLMRIHGKKAIVLIDEYDVPLENAHFMGFYDKMVSFIRSLFESALKTNSSLEMAVLTGCLRVSKESLFTGLNNLQINSIQSGQFSEYFGFTEGEIKDLTEYFELSDKFSSIKEWYDGYRFGETEIYNPWSVLNYMQEVRTVKTAMPAPYWSNTSSNSIIHQLITNADEDTRDVVEELVNGGSITAPIHENMVYADIEVNQDGIWSFLLGMLNK
ncbi:MAG: AAA family ATPase [Oscillospiraceae bacterium]